MSTKGMILTERITVLCPNCGGSFKSTKKGLFFQKTCSQECGNAMIGKSQDGRTKDSKLKRQWRKEHKEHVAIAEEHVKTIFTDGYEPKEDDLEFGILENQGILL